MNIGRVPDRVLRLRILDLYADHGAQTPTFHVVGDRLLAFLVTATELTLKIALQDPQAVVLGRV